jgi:hypothetical protein
MKNASWLLTKIDVAAASRQDRSWEVPVTGMISGNIGQYFEPPLGEQPKRDLGAW